MYKVGVIGLGQIGFSIDKDPNRKFIWSHFGAYQKINKCQIVAICDTNTQLIKEVKNSYHIQNTYNDYEEMLKNNHLDIVSVCTPIQTHYEIIKKCIAYGVKAIFCEKTISYSLEEAKEIEQLCQKNNVVFAVNYTFRWDKNIQKIKSLLSNNTIGKIYSIVGYGATALHTSTSHLIDLICYFANSEINWVNGVIQEDYVRKVHQINDHGGFATVHFKSGIIAFIKGVSTSPYHYMLEIDILGENGRIRLCNEGQTIEIYQYQQSSESSPYKSMLLISSNELNQENERMIYAIEDIIQCLENGGETISNIHTAIASLKIIDGIKKSNHSQ